MTTVISASDVSKKYTIAHDAGPSYKTLRDELTAGMRRLVGLGDPRARNTSEEFWALDHLSFEVRHGERVGIIGRNGAGKSTLLKILSKVVEPTTGRIEIRGRLSSLLEVGTGFHPELTGRENVFLNGAILGMSRNYIRHQFDEIVEFSGVERFIDTPVKHYSSGMYMRLAFAVAANLAPDILLIDEVLAVGDLAFQQKCLGKIESITNTGRTVLFVSHSLSSITALCTSAMLLDAGRIVASGNVSEVVMRYYSEGSSSPAAFDFRHGNKYVGSQQARLLAGFVRNPAGAPSPEITISERATIEMDFEIIDARGGPFLPNFHFYTSEGVAAFVSVDPSGSVRAPGTYKVRCEVPAHFLNEGTYFVGFGLTTFAAGVTVHFFERGAVSFNVRDPIVGTDSRGGWAGSMPGAVRPSLNWTTEKIA